MTERGGRAPLCSPWPSGHPGIGRSDPYTQREEESESESERTREGERERARATDVSGSTEKRARGERRHGSLLSILRHKGVGQLLLL